MPREERDLFIAATNGHLLAFDNLSDIPARTSDALCRLASGGSFAIRQLYTDADEALFEAACPAILNGIEDVISQAGSGGPCDFSDPALCPRNGTTSGKGDLAEFETCATAHPRCVVGGREPRLAHAARGPPAAAAAHGGFCPVGDRL